MLVLNPLWLLLALAALPIFLLHARRTSRKVVSSVLLWRQIAAQRPAARSWHWPRLSLLMLLQLLILALLVLAAANLRIVPSQMPDHTVLVLDASAPMRGETEGGGSAFAHAQADLSSILETMAGADQGRYSLILVDGNTRPLAVEWTDPEALRAALDTVSISDETPDWAGVGLWLETLIDPQERTALHIASLTPEALPVPQALGDTLTLTATPLLPASRPGFALRVESSGPDSETGLWLLSASVTGPAEADLPSAVTARFAPDGTDQLLEWGSIAIVAADGGEATRGRFSTRLDLPSSGRLVLELPHDATPQDNRYFEYVTSVPVPRVLVVGAPAPELEKALAATGDLLLTHSETLPDDSSTFDLVVLNGPHPASAPQTNTLWLAPSALSSDAPVPLPLEARLSGWDAAHPLSRGLAWEQAESIIYLPGLLPRGGDTIAAIGTDRVITARTRPFGRDVFLAVDLTDSAWTQNPGFPVFIANMLVWQGIGTQQQCIAGIPCALDRFTRTAQIFDADGMLVHDGPRLLEAGDILAPSRFVPRRAGFYTAMVDDQTRTFAVNSPHLVASDITETAEAPLPGWDIAAPFAFRPWLIVAAIILLGVEFAYVAFSGHRPNLSVMDRLWQNRVTGLARILTIAALVPALLAAPLPQFGPQEIRVAVLDPGTPGENTALPPDIPAITTAADTSSDDAPRLDLADAVSWATALSPLPARVAIAGDGQPSARLAEHATSPHAAPLDRLTPAPAPADNLSVVALAVPAEVAMGQTYEASIVVSSATENAARLITLRNGLTVDSQDLTLQPGLNRASAYLTALETGTDLIEAVLEPSGTVIAGNDFDGARVNVVPAPPILVLAGDPEQGAAFSNILGVQGLDATVISPLRAPRTLAEWLAYEVIVLLDVPARDLQVDQIDMLRQSVETHGRGLLLAGDANAFGPGGYYGTVLEDLSPLSSRVPHDRPQTAFVFVIDRSGSMDVQVGSVVRLDIAKGAVLNVIDLLEPDDLMAVIGFDEDPQTIIDLQLREETDFSAIINAVVAGGGTALFPALNEAITMLEGAGARHNHIIVLTDGLVEPVDFSRLLERAQTAGITISTVAAGNTAITERLAQIAHEGGGTNYATRDFRTLPSILMQDVMMLDSPLATDGPAPVVRGETEGAIAGALPDAIPSLDRHIWTTLKPDAENLLGLMVDGEERPLLASWRYGSGTVMALSANPSAEGMQNWAALPHYPRVWAQAVRTLVPDVMGPGLTLDAVRNGSGADITAHLIGVDGAPIPGASLSAEILETGQTVMLAEIAPGVHRGEIARLALGPTTIEARIGDIVGEAALYTAYPAQYRYSFADPHTLDRIALASGGMVAQSVADLPAIRWAWHFVPNVAGWLVLALILWLADLIVVRPWRRLRG